MDFEPLTVSDTFKILGISVNVRIDGVVSTGGLSGDEDVETAIDTLVEENAMTYHDLLASQTASARSVLRAIAAEGCAREVSSKQFTSKYALPAGSTVRYAIADLVAKDLLCRVQSGYRVYDRIFSIWLSRLP